MVLAGSRGGTLAPERVNAIVIESVESTGTEWGLSLTDSNPKEEDYFKMPDKEIAFRLKEKLAIHSPISFDKPLGSPTNELLGVE